MDKKQRVPCDVCKEYLCRKCQKTINGRVHCPDCYLEISITENMDRFEKEVQEQWDDV